MEKEVSGCAQNGNESYTNAYQRNIDCGYGYKFGCCYDDKYSEPVATYMGENAVNQFMVKMFEEVKYCKKVKMEHFNKDMVMTSADKRDFKSTSKYHICDKEYVETDIRVRDQCHVTGRYRGSAHQDCIINFKLTDKIPVIFHNLRGYDSRAQNNGR